MPGLPPHTELHVVLHGLICLRLSYASRTAQLLIPSVPMHEYHLGTFGDTKPLETGHDYQLGGVQVGHLRLTSDQVRSVKQEHITICLGEHEGLNCYPRGTHATVTLPWPNKLSGVRKIMNPPPDLFPGTGVNPQSLRYVSYLTYNVYRDDSPVVTKGCFEYWSQGLRPRHARLHFFADPWKSLQDKQLPGHLMDAYASLNDQVFLGGIALRPAGVPWNFDPKSDYPDDVPDAEAVDFSYPGVPPDPEVKKPGVKKGSGGNCGAVFALD